MRNLKFKYTNLHEIDMQLIYNHLRNDMNCYFLAFEE